MIPRWVREPALGLVLLSAGVIIGTYFRSGVAGTPIPGRVAPDPAAERPPARVTADSVDAVSRPIAASTATAAAQAGDPYLAGSPREDFAGEYAVLRGAATVEDAPRPGAVEGVVLRAPSVSLGESGAPVNGDASAEAGATGEREAPERFRPSPAQGIPRGIALRHPLLALARPGGRVTFHTLGIDGGPTPAGIEGEWAVIGRCDRTARVEFALPSSRTGQLRAIGRSAADGPWEVEPVVARQACGAASDRYHRPRAATPADRATYGALGTGAGFSAEDLHQVIELRAAALLVFRRSGAGSQVLGVVLRGGGAAVAWSHVAPPGDGDLRLLGVYRTGARGEAWMTLGSPASAHAVVLATSPDLRSWAVAGPFPLREP